MAKRLRRFRLRFWSNKMKWRSRNLENPHEKEQITNQCWLQLWSTMILYPPTLPRLGQGRAAPGSTVGVERCFLSKPSSSDLKHGALHDTTDPASWRCRRPPCQGLGEQDVNSCTVSSAVCTVHPSGALATASVLLCGVQNWPMHPVPPSNASRLPGWLYGVSKLTDGPLSRSQRLPQAQNVVGAGFSHAAAGSLSGFMGFQNWRMAPCPDLKGSPRPKMSLELALAMLRLPPSLVLWCFKTDGWPPVPISKAPPGPKCPSPKCRWSWL